MKKDIIAESIEAEEREKFLSENKHYQVVINDNKNSVKYFDTLVEARDFISGQHKEAAIFHKKNSCGSYRFMENITF
jgi:hypothetical protein